MAVITELTEIALIKFQGPKEGPEKVQEGPAHIEEIIEVPEGEEAVEGTGAILDAPMPQAPCSSTMSAPSTSTITSCSTTRWPCRTSTASPAGTEEIDGEPRFVAT